jgi:hypothetical protein
MTPLEDKLRAALRETAGEIPADPPPLRLRSRRREGFGLGGRAVHAGRRRWITWAAPLASAALVVAVIAASLAVTGGAPRPQATPAGPAGVPPYYVALVTGKAQPDEDNSAGAVAEVRATTTGAVLARIVPPKPYADFSGVSAAADDRTFVLVAEEKFNPPATVQQEAREYPFGGYTPRARFFLLHIDPNSVTPGGRASLQALPAGFIPAGYTVHDMALSPDGHSLAADVGGVLFNSQLYVFNLATGTKRAWSFKTCSHCYPSSGGLGFGGVNVDALSWTADGRYVAFVGPGRNLLGASAVRLLDTTAPGTNLVAESKPVAAWPGGSNDSGPDWRGGIITPDGRTVVIIEELVANGPTRGVSVREQLAKVSVATGKITAVLNNLPVAGGYEQVLYTDATGNALVVSYARPGMSAGILRGDTYTPIPWTPQTSTAAW